MHLLLEQYYRDLSRKSQRQDGEAEKGKEEERGQDDFRRHHARLLEALYMKHRQVKC